MTKRKRRQTRGHASEDNPVIGYVLINASAQVIDPTGQQLDPAYGSEASAWQAAEQAGCRAAGARAAPLWLGGVLTVVWGDVGDIQLDGEAAQALVRACQRRGLAHDAARARQIRGDEAAPVYSSRALLQARQA